MERHEDPNDPPTTAERHTGERCVARGCMQTAETARDAGPAGSEQPVKPRGPVLTNKDGNLSRRVWMCAWGDHRCAHYSVHDWHYPYCSTRPDSAPALRPGAGMQLRSPKPDDGCPYLPAVAVAHHP